MVTSYMENGNTFTVEKARFLADTRLHLREKAYNNIQELAQNFFSRIPQVRKIEYDPKRYRLTIMTSGNILDDVISRTIEALILNYYEFYIVKPYGTTDFMRKAFSVDQLYNMIKIPPYYFIDL